jgi:MoxR-like ATPase
VTTQETEPRSATFAELFGTITAAVGRAIRGKADVVELAVLCMVSEGHLLLEDVPGVGKTTLAKALAASVDAEFGRIQFTPDLLPSDVVGVTVWNRSADVFEFRPGPVFASIVLGDELNRASPKTQSALLEAMAENQVTVDGTTYPLGPPFMVVATQNPVEHEGTYPLPESQLDRFLMKASVGYPDRSSELEVLDTHGDAVALARLSPVATAADVNGLIAAARTVHASPAVRGYLVDLADATRRHPHLALGMSPRATLSLLRVARSRAAAQGRAYVVPDDIKMLAEPVLAHRLVVTPEAQLQGITPADALGEVLATIPVPTAAGQA